MKMHQAPICMLVRFKQLLQTAKLDSKICRVNEPSIC